MTVQCTLYSLQSVLYTLHPTQVDISIYGVGVSVVNNESSVRKELAYLSVRSSEVVWEIRKEGKQLEKLLLSPN